MAAALNLKGYACAFAEVGDVLGDQDARLIVAGCAVRVLETVHNPAAARQRLRTTLSFLEPWDTLVVCSMNRLGGRLCEIVDFLHDLDALDCGLQSLDEPEVNFAPGRGARLIGLLTVADSIGDQAWRGTPLVPSPCACFVERKVGRAFKLPSGRRAELLSRLSAGETQQTLAREFGISQPTVSRMRL